jgi:hypothetical protein
MCAANLKLVFVLNREPTKQVHFSKMPQWEPVWGGQEKQLWDRVHPENFRGVPSPPSVWILRLCIFILECVYRRVGVLEGVWEEGSKCGRF